jgi:hypothetical protein
VGGVITARPSYRLPLRIERGTPLYCQYPPAAFAINKLTALMLANAMMAALFLTMIGPQMWTSEDWSLPFTVGMLVMGAAGDDRVDALFF